MSIADFVLSSGVLHEMTLDFARAVPDDRWNATPVPPESARPPAPRRIGRGFAPFSKQLRHVVCARGVYNAALATGSVDWSRRHEYYTGPLTREGLLAGLDEQRSALIATLDTVDPTASFDWNGTPFTFDLVVAEFVQHEAIHHGQWSVYAELAGFDTPLSWRSSWGL
jgi:DinB family protein